MIAPIVMWPEEILKQMSAPVAESEFNTDELKEFAKTLVDTMAAARGLGISAPQLGVLKRIIVVPNPVKFTEHIQGDPDSDKVVRPEEPPFVVLCNPEVSPLLSTPICKEQEGCLSLPGVLLRHERFHSVRVLGKTVEGQLYDQVASGVPAIAAQHEVDHLNGKTIADNIGPMQKHMIMNKLKKFSRAMERAERKQEQAKLESIRAKARQADEYAFNRKNSK